MVIAQKEESVYILDSKGRRQYRSNCVDCNTLISRRSKRCIECSGKHRSTLKKINECDCGKMIAYASKSCRRCAGKQRTKLNNEKRRMENGL